MAPGAYGQPPRPPADASKVWTPSCRPASTLASAVPRVSWKCSAICSSGTVLQHGVEHHPHLRRVGDADGVADRHLEDAHVEQAARHIRDVGRIDAPSNGQPNAVDT